MTLILPKLTNWRPMHSKNAIEITSNNFDPMKITSMEFFKLKWRRSGVFIVNLDYISHLFRVFLLLTLKMVGFLRTSERFSLSFKNVVHNYKLWMQKVQTQADANLNTPPYFVRKNLLV